MSDIGALVERLIECGLSVGEASSIIAEAVAAGAATAAYRRSPGALRTEKWREGQRHKASQSVTCDAGETENESVTKRHIPSQSVTSDKVPLSTFSNIKKRERQNRGSRIAPDWSPSDAEKSFARQEGYSEFEVHREINKFRDYWTACAGAKGVKLDWSATWRQWVRNGAERAGKTPAPQSGASAASGFYAKADSEQLAAWTAHAVKSGSKLPRDKNGGWRVQAEWPPGYVPPEGPQKLSFDLKRGLSP